MTTIRNFIICVGLTIMTALNAVGSTIYIVSTTRGTIKIKKNRGRTWNPISQLDKIGLMDSIILADNAFIEFYNAGDGRRYSIKDRKKVRVSEVVGEVKSTARKGVIESVLSTGFPEDKVKRYIAASERGDDGTDPVTLSIYQAIISGKNIGYPQDVWAKKVIEGNNFSITLGNRGKKLGFIEIYAVRSDGHVERVDMIDNGNLPLMGGATIQIPYNFANATEFWYLLVSSLTPFDATYLENLLNDHKPVDSPISSGTDVTLLVVE